MLVLDDGFQHHRIARQLDVVLIDAAAGLGNRFTLPRGPLREPVAALRFADAIGVVGGALADEDEALVARLAPRAFRFTALRRATSLRPLGGGERLPLSSLRGREVGLLAGIARPASLRESVSALGALIVGERVFADHHVYRPADVSDLVAHAALWITTEKDALKIPRSWVGRAQVWSLAITFAVTDPPALLDWMEARLR